MAEQRLIDANNLGIGMAYQSEFYPNYFAIGWNSALKAVTEISPTIDPETIPIVRQLRDELEQAKSERDAAFKLIGWIYYEACVSVEHDMRQHIDWLKDKIEEWKKIG